MEDTNSNTNTFLQENYDKCNNINIFEKCHYPFIFFFI